MLLHLHACLSADRIQIAHATWHDMHTCPYAAEAPPDLSVRGRPHVLSAATRTARATTVPVKSAARSRKLNSPGHHCRRHWFALSCWEQEHTSLNQDE